jgi:hypothetical protein
VLTISSSKSDLSTTKESESTSSKFELGVSEWFCVDFSTPFDLVSRFSFSLKFGDVSSSNELFVLFSLVSSEIWML